MGNSLMSFDPQTSGKNALNIQSTGSRKGGDISINVTNTLFDISAGTGKIVDNSDADNPRVAELKWDASLANTVTNLATANGTFLAITAVVAGVPTIEQKITNYTALERRTKIVLGGIGHPNRTTITATACQQTPIYDPYSFIYDLGIFVEFINQNGGNTITADGANLSLDRAAGSIFAPGINYGTDPGSPHISAIDADSVLTFSPVYRDGSGGSTADADDTTINPNSIDDGDGTLGTVGNNNFTIQRVFLVPRSSISPAAGQHAIAYGQTEYNSFIVARDALLTDPFIFPSEDLSQFLLLAVIIIQQGTTDLASAISGGSALIATSDKFGQKYLNV